MGYEYEWWQWIIFIIGGSCVALANIISDDDS